ncbi:glycoside hydrolase family 25 protein [Streptomyces sp. NPDC023723]|uniref:glycoside hydrolase family 25 protein n=1 Tax=Streptomyces sp. NPDC023723 TaxID=3154323 RepID=UPI0033D3FC4A
MTITGIDVSNYQSATYSLTGHDFVVVKATEGVSYVNPKHAAQVKRARDNGRVVGHYHYLNGNSSMAAQMNYFLAEAGARAGEFLAVDWEEAGVSGAEKDQALKYLIGKAGGRKVLLYCSQSYWTTRDTTSYAGDGLWVAQYNGRPGRPSIQADWLIHQYTSSPLDTNVAQFASRAAMAAWAAGEEEDVALTDADIKEIAETTAKKVLQIDGVIANPNSATAKSNPYISAATALRNIEIVTRRSEIAINALQATVEKLAGLLGENVDTATVVAAVQDAVQDAVANAEVGGAES